MTTPRLLMDGTRIRDSYRELKAALPGFDIAYAMKANPHVNIITILNNEGNRFKGAHFETASIEEIRLLLSLHIPPHNIIFSNPIKPIEAIEDALNLGIQVFTFDGIEEARKFIPHLRGARKFQLVFRIDVPNIGALWALNGKFGASRPLWKTIFSEMQKEGLNIDGITFHVGSQCETLESWEQAMLASLEAILEARKYDHNISILNIGGGFPIYLGREVPKPAEIGSVIWRHLNNWEKSGVKMKRLIAEPGRFICGSAGTMETKIIGVAERETNGVITKWVFLDAGVFTGLMETIDEITYPVLSNGEGDPIEVMLCGPSCDSADKLFKVQIPNPKIGDTLYLSGAGAYTNVYASRFNGLPIPEICFLDPIQKSDEEEAALI